jgi:hypothetical protein
MPRRKSFPSCRAAAPAMMGGREQETAPRGGVPLEPEREPRADGDAGAGDAGHQRESLRDADQHPVPQARARPAALLASQPVGRKHHKGDSRSGGGDEKRMAQALLDDIPESHPRNGRRDAPGQDEKTDQPGVARGLVAAPPGQREPRKRGKDVHPVPARSTTAPPRASPRGWPGQRQGCSRPIPAARARRSDAQCWKRGMNSVAPCTAPRMTA